MKLELREVDALLEFHRQRVGRTSLRIAQLEAQREKHHVYAA